MHACQWFHQTYIFGWESLNLLLVSKKTSDGNFVESQTMKLQKLTLTMIQHVNFPLFSSLPLVSNFSARYAASELHNDVQSVRKLELAAAARERVRDDLRGNLSCCQVPCELVSNCNFHRPIAVQQLH